MTGATSAAAKDASDAGNSTRYNYVISDVNGPGTRTLEGTSVVRDSVSQRLDVFDNGELVGSFINVNFERRPA